MRKPSFDLNKYKKAFSESKLWTFLPKQFKKMGVKVVYVSLLMFYAWKNDNTPSWAKNIILGSLGYLVSPVDLLPDLTPVLGFTDDFGVLSFGLVTISCYITSANKLSAKENIFSWFGKDDIQVSELACIDQRL